MMTRRFLRTRFLWSGLTLLLTSVATSAHICGPPRIDVEVGKAALWRIYADRSETLSFYQPVLVGSPAVAEVYPKQDFRAHHGDFLITGHSPGTNVLQVEWSYQPTGAGGVCQVMIVVTPDDGVKDLETLTASGLLVARTGEPGISSSELFFQIDRYIPRQSPKLLIFAQCFGGNMALHGLFQNMPNTTILSATSPNQESHYGGYHDDAARALKPEAGRTAETVHEEGSIGKSTIIPKDPSDTSPDPVDPTQDKETFHVFAELPRVTGTLPPSQFSLEPVTLDGAVRSRHIVIFAGRPDSKSEFVLRQGTFTIPASAGTKERFADIEDRDQILENFPADATTTVSAVGGEPGDAGWDHSGDLAGLHQAIKTAGEAIEAAADPSKEQFILFVTDHGEAGAELFPTPRLVPQSLGSSWSVAAATTRTPLGAGLRPYSIDDPIIDSMLRSSDNQPAVRLRIAIPPGENLQLLPNSLALEFSNDQGVVLELNSASAITLDLDGDGMPGSIPEEGILVFFPLEESDLINLLLPRPFSVDLINGTGREFEITEALLLTGAISMGNSRPQPFISSAVQLPNRNIEIVVNGLEGERHVVETSSDLTQWEPVQERVFTTSKETFSLIPSASENHLFIRVSRP